jgi:hypothetical protein
MRDTESSAGRPTSERWYSRQPQRVATSRAYERPLTPKPIVSLEPIA